MFFIRITSLLFISLLAKNVLAAEALTFFKTGDGDSDPQEITSIEDFELVSGDRLLIRTDVYKDISAEIRRAYVSVEGNKVFSGTVLETLALRLVVSPTGDILGSVSTPTASFNLFSDGGAPFIESADSYQNQLPIDSVGNGVALDLPISDAFTTKSFKVTESRISPENARFPEYSTDDTTLDVFIYFDEDLSSPKLVIDYLIEYTNDIYDVMGLELQFQVAGTQKIDIAEDVQSEKVLQDIRERNSPFTDLDKRIASSGADLIHYVRGEDTISDECGIANLSVRYGIGLKEGNAGITNFRAEGCRADRDHTFTHEIGHNLGSSHNREEYDTDPGGAYEYSFGSRVSGEYRTIMSYGDGSTFPLYGTFSWPEARCSGIPCGVSVNKSDSADNRRSINNTKRLVTAYGGDFNPSGIQEISHTMLNKLYDEPLTCESGAPWKGWLIFNNSSSAVEVVYGTLLRPDGTVYVAGSLSDGELNVQPGEFDSWGYCGDGEEQPIGSDVGEIYFVYEHPDTGELIEGTHVFFDDNYSGDYAIVRAAAGPGGSVVGNPSLHARVNVDTEIIFEPDYGYKLSSVSGTCPGSLHYNVYTAEPVYGDCWAIANFEPLEGVDLIQQHFSNLLQTVMSVRSNEASSAKAEASEATVSTNSNESLR
jgi:hypothetical protein